MREIEIKILKINRQAIERKLRQCKAKKFFSGLLKTTYFDFSDFSLARNRQVLRLRDIEKKSFLTFKTRLPNRKTISSEEIEFEVGSSIAAAKFLKRLGFQPVLSYQKKRVSYRLGKTRIELDNYLGKFKKIPLFLEIEATTEKELFIALKKLGFARCDAKPWHGSQLLAHYGFKNIF